MAELGAVASVIQVAQFGARLSLTLYSVAQTVGSANRDVKRIAKEIALFAQVLKDLGQALGRGQTSKVYREDAFETSRMIVEECEDVFEEIEEILKKATKEAKPLEASVVMPKVERFLWVFRKERVQLLRSNLESLKSTISPKLAVLTYADKRASTMKRYDDADDLLCLKSLVLANETATSELRELTNSNTEKLESLGTERLRSPGPIATHGVLDVLSSNRQSVNPHIRSFHTPARKPEHWSPSTSAFAMPANFAHFNVDQNPSLLRYSAPESSTLGVQFPQVKRSRISVESRDFSERYKRFWGDLDRLELAVRKLDTAKWELERISENMKLRPVEEQGRKLSLLLGRLQDGLEKFGLSTKQIPLAVNSLFGLDKVFGLRTEISQKISKLDISFEQLQVCGVTYEEDKDSPDHVVLRRWVPEYFEDILWSQTKHLIDEMQTQMMTSTTAYRVPAFGYPQKTELFSCQQNKASEEMYQMPLPSEVLPRRVNAMQQHQPKPEKVQSCEFPGCDKVFTRVEHRRRHELSHSPEVSYPCEIVECQKGFHRPDLLMRHMERQHNDPELQRQYCHQLSLGQVSAAESDSASTAITTTVPPIPQTAMLDAVTQASSAMSIYSIVDPTTPHGFVSQSMDTFNDPSQLAVPAGPCGFPPDLVYGASTSDDSPFYSSDSCYSLDREYPPASQSYFPMQPMAFEQQQYQQHQQQVNDLYYQRKPQEERTMARQQEYQQTITYLQARALHNRRQQANRTPGTRNSAKRQQRQMSQQARSMVQPPQLQRVQMRSNSLTAIPNDMKAWEPNISNQPLSYTSMQSNVDSVQRYIPMIEADPLVFPHVNIYEWITVHNHHL